MLNWVEPRKGSNHRETQALLQLLGMSYMSAKDYTEAEKYFKRLSTTYGGEDSKEAQEVNYTLQLLHMNTMVTARWRVKNSINLSNFLSELRF